MNLGGILFIRAASKEFRKLLLQLRKIHGGALWRGQTDKTRNARQILHVIGDKILVSKHQSIGAPAQCPRIDMGTPAAGPSLASDQIAQQGVVRGKIPQVMIVGDDGRPPVANEIDCLCIVAGQFARLDEEKFVGAACMLTEFVGIHSVREMSDDVRKIRPRPDIVTVVVERQRFDAERPVKQHPQKCISRARIRCELNDH